MLQVEEDTSIVFIFIFFPNVLSLASSDPHVSVPTIHRIPTLLLPTPRPHPARLLPAAPGDEDDGGERVKLLCGCVVTSFSIFCWW